MRTSTLWYCALLFAGAAGLASGMSKSVAAAEADDKSLPRLTVKDWYFEINGEPAYLVGYSLGPLEEKQHLGHPDSGRLARLPKGVNYMRTWLEWQRDGKYPCPFIQVEGKADLSRIDPAWLEGLRVFLDASARAGVVQELTLFNPWFARDDWASDYWNPANNVQGLKVDERSLFTLGNPCQPYQEQWVDAVLETVDASLARNFVIIEIDNELKTGGGAWREHFATRVKGRGDYIVSTIASYCGDYDAVGGPNDIVCMHSAGSGNVPQYHRWTTDLNRVKPLIFNELFVWWHQPRETQRAVFWNALVSGSMVCVYQWDDGDTTFKQTEQDLAGLARFAHSIPFHRFHPGGDWLKRASGHACAAVRDDGQAFLAYLWGGANGNVEVTLPEAEYTVSWIDPTTGERLGEVQNLKASGTVDLGPPAYAHDVACYIERAGNS